MEQEESRTPFSDQPMTWPGFLTPESIGIAAAGKPGERSQFAEPPDGAPALEMGPKGAEIFLVRIFHSKLRLNRSLAIQVRPTCATVGPTQCANVHQWASAFPKKGMLRSVGRQIRLPSNPTDAVHVIRCGVIALSQSPGR